jgi:putative transcriptional regulator
MPIIVNLDVVLARRKLRLNDLAGAVGITPQNLSILKTGKARAIRFSTLEAICRYLECQPGDILEYRPGPALASEAVPEPETGSAHRPMPAAAPDFDPPSELRTTDL